MASPDTGSVQIGILSYNEDRELAEKYLMDIGVQCGFIKLKLGLQESIAIILKTLEATEARGNRKYVRAKLQNLIYRCLQDSMDTYIQKIK